MPNTQPEKLSNPLSLNDPLPAEYWHASGDTGSNLRDLVLGISDGLVTVLSFVAGSTALLANTNQVLRTGFAEMFAGGVSMGLGAYLGSRSQRELYEKERQREQREVEEMPERERDEIRNIYARKGFSGAELEMIVARLSEDKTRWVDLMMTEELGFGNQGFDNPRRTGLIVFAAYFIGALFPLTPYIIMQLIGADSNPDTHRTLLNIALICSVILTMLVLFAFGTFKSRFTHKLWWQSGLEMVLTGAVGATIVYTIGWMADNFLFR